MLNNYVRRPENRIYSFVFIYCFFNLDATVSIFFGDASGYLKDQKAHVFLDKIHKGSTSTYIFLG